VSRALPRHHAVRLSRGGLLLTASLVAILLVSAALPAPALAALAGFGLVLIAIASTVVAHGLAAAGRLGLRAEVRPIAAHGAERGLARLVAAHPERLEVRFGPPSAPRLLAVGAIHVEGSGGISGTVVAFDEQARLATVDIAAPRAGYAQIHAIRLEGRAAGAVLEVALRLPTFLAFRVLPRPAGQQGAALFDATRASSDSSRDAVMRRQRGSGLEVRELREFVAGDPYKHVAWRATARRGRVMVREFETDARLSAWLLVDVSPSMMWGAPGETGLDRAIELATMAISALLAGQDRVGLILHDHRVRLVVEPAHGPAQRQALLAALLEAHHLTHEDRTEVTHDELLSAIEGWFHLQAGRLFRLPGGLFRGLAPSGSPIDEARLLSACEAVLSNDARWGPLPPPPPPAGPLSPEPSRARLRSFCRAVGIDLPTESESRPGGQAQGLMASIETLMRMSSRGHGRSQTIIALSDLATAHDPLLLKRIAVASRRARHQLVFVVPGRRWDTVPSTGAPTSHLVERVLRAQRHVDAHRCRETETWLRPAGATFVHVDPEEGLARALARIRAAS
jgi:uncharacterized protein (DUF58 family)